MIIGMTTRRLFLLVFLWLPGTTPLVAQTPIVSFDWEVRNRFRLFSHEADFDRHVDAWKQSAGEANRVLASETRLAALPDSAGHGWARHARLCVDRASGRIPQKCERVDADGNAFSEFMINPRSHRIRFIAHVEGAPSATCIWDFGTGIADKRVERDCALEVSNRLLKGVAAPVSLTVRLAMGEVMTAPAQSVEARDVLIVGMGDSIASGEGNPNDPVRLREDGFCYRRAGAGNHMFILPSRVRDSTIPSACPEPAEVTDFRDLFAKTAAGWIYAQCHRSLYSHQTRMALALAVEQRKIAVTYIPLGCSGAEIMAGMINGMAARERPVVAGRKAPATVTAQFAELASYIGANGKVRKPDLVLVTVGANDIGFGGLVSDVILVPGFERQLLEGKRDTIVSPQQARVKLNTKLPTDFRKLRTRLAAFTGDLAGRVVFTAYGNPAGDEDGEVCKETRRGFDAHPAFAIDAVKMKAASQFVDNEFIPKLHAMAQCASGTGCAQPAKQSIAFVDAHREAFARHGLCAAAASDPAFDRNCFRDGTSFENGTIAKPMACSLAANLFRAYSPRARWIRTANDSYFAAMSYVENIRNQPTDIHDAVWGMSAVVLGGAIHPTAEGHAAMADAALTEARKALKLTAP